LGLPDAVLILGLGHIHIGSVNVTMRDVTNGNRLVMTSKPTYNENGFITHISRVLPNYTLKRGDKYDVEATYNNVRAYAGVMGLFQIFVYVEGYY